MTDKTWPGAHSAPLEMRGCALCPPIGPGLFLSVHQKVPKLVPEYQRQLWRMSKQTLRDCAGNRCHALCFQKRISQAISQRLLMMRQLRRHHCCWRLEATCGPKLSAPPARAPPIEATPRPHDRGLEEPPSPRPQRLPRGTTPRRCRYYASGRMLLESGRRDTRSRVRVSWAVGHRGCNTVLHG